MKESEDGETEKVQLFSGDSAKGLKDKQTSQEALGLNTTQDTKQTISTPEDNNRGHHSRFDSNRHNTSRSTVAASSHSIATENYGKVESPFIPAFPCTTPEIIDTCTAFPEGFGDYNSAIDADSEYGTEDEEDEATPENHPTGQSNSISKRPYRLLSSAHHYNSWDDYTRMRTGESLDPWSSRIHSFKFATNRLSVSPRTIVEKDSSIFTHEKQRVRMERMNHQKQVNYNNDINCDDACAQEANIMSRPLTAEKLEGMNCEKSQLNFHPSSSMSYLRRDSTHTSFSDLPCHQYCYHYQTPIDAGSHNNETRSPLHGPPPNVVSDFYDLPTATYISQPLLTSNNSSPSDHPPSSEWTLFASFLRRITSPVQSLVPSTLFERPPRSDKPLLPNQPRFRRFRNVMPQNTTYQSGMNLSSQGTLDGFNGKRPIRRRRNRQSIRVAGSEHSICDGSMFHLEKHQLREQPSHEAVVSQVRARSFSPSISSPSSNDMDSSNQLYMKKYSSLRCGPPGSWNRNVLQEERLKRQLAPPMRRKNTGRIRPKKTEKRLYKNSRKSSRQGSKGHWREVVGFCEAQRYDIGKLHADLVNAGIPTEFVDEQRTILKINSHQLLESSLVDQTEQIEVGKAPFKTVTESDEGRKVLPESNVKNTTIESEEIDSFVFENGVSIIWGLRDAEENTDHANILARFLFKYCERPISFSSQPRFCMTFCLIEELPPDFPVPASRVKHDRFYMKTGDIQEKLAASLALAQSTRLTVYEEAVDETIRKFGKLPLRIAANEFYEYLNYGSTEVVNMRKWVAEVYKLVIDVNIVEDFLDIPEYFWHYDQYQPFWGRIHKYLDVEERIQILNVRVGCIQEILKVVSNERVEAQGFHLAWCVIILLAVNVIAIVIRETLDRRH